MRSRTPAAFAVAASAALLLAACSGTSSSTGHDMSTMGMSPSPSTSTSPAASAAAAGSFNRQDVMFAEMMAAHHLQAVEMADVVLEKTGVDPRVTALATRIKTEQEPEIETMNGWLTSWGSKPVTSSMSGMSMGSGNGMMSMEDMTALSDASAAKTPTLFLSGMIAHHTGAIAMARVEVAEGKNGDAVTLAKGIITSQSAEISTMKQLLGSV